MLVRGSRLLSTISPSVLNILFYGRAWGSKEKTPLIPYIFNILSHFCFIIFKANCPFEKCRCAHILSGRGSEKVHILNTHFKNVDNYGLPIKTYMNLFLPWCSKTGIGY